MWPNEARIVEVAITGVPSIPHPPGLRMPEQIAKMWSDTMQTPTMLDDFRRHDERFADEYPSALQRAGSE